MKLDKMIKTAAEMTGLGDTGYRQWPTKAEKIRRLPVAEMLEQMGVQQTENEKESASLEAEYNRVAPTYRAMDYDENSEITKKFFRVVNAQKNNLSERRALDSLKYWAKTTRLSYADVRNAIDTYDRWTSTLSKSDALGLLDRYAPGKAAMNKAQKKGPDAYVWASATKRIQA